MRTSLFSQPKDFPHYLKCICDVRKAFNHTEYGKGGYKGSIYSLNPAGGVQAAGGSQKERELKR